MDDGAAHSCRARHGRPTLCPSHFQVLHHGTFAQELSTRVPFLHGLVYVAIFPPERPLHERLAHERADLRECHRLGHAVISPCFHGLHGQVNTPKGGHEDDRRLWPVAVHRAHEPYPVHACHAPIGEHDRDGLLLKDLQGNFGTGGCRDGIAFAGEIVP